MRVVLLVLVWAAAGIVAVTALFSAFVGRADFGGGSAAPMSDSEAAVLVAVAGLVLVAAGWVTRRILR